MKRERRSAKDVVNQYAGELLSRPGGMETDAKLLAVEQIAFRMGWTELYNRLRYRRTQPQSESWWQK